MPIQASNGKMYQNDKNFDYAFTSVAIPANSSGSVSIVIDSDADFEASGLTYFAFPTASPAAQTDATRYVPLVSINIQDTGTSEFIFSQQVPINTVAGTGEQPAMLRKPRVFSSRSNVTLFYTNVQADGVTLSLVMRGKKLVGIAN